MTKRIESITVLSDNIPTLPPVPALPPPSMEAITGDFSPTFILTMDGYEGSFTADELQLSTGPIGPDDPIPSDPEREAAEDTLRNSAEFAKIPLNVQFAIQMSRTMLIAFAKALDGGMKIQVVDQPAGGNAASYDKTSNTMYLKQSYVDAANGEPWYGFNSENLAGVVFHELGHALTVGSMSVDVSTRADFIDDNLSIEAMAVVFNLTAYHLLGKQNIDVPVQAGNTNGVFYTFYSQYVTDGNIDSLISKIKGQLQENGTYPDYYGSYWDEHYKDK